MQQFLPTKSHSFLYNSGHSLYSFRSSQSLCLLFYSVLLPCWHGNKCIFISTQFVKFFYLCSISDFKENLSNLSRNLNSSDISRNYLSSIIYHSMHNIHENGKLLLLAWPYFTNKDYKVLVNWDLKGNFKKCLIVQFT